MLDLSGGLIKSERCRHHAAKPRGFYLNRLSELLLPLLPRALVGLALQLAAREQVLEEVDALDVLVVAVLHPALLGVRQAQVEALAVVVLAALTELAAHAEGRHRHWDAALGLVLVCAKEEQCNAERAW